jgi:hypothetical protein
MTNEKKLENLNQIKNNMNIIINYEGFKYFFNVGVKLKIYKADIDRIEFLKILFSTEMVKFLGMPNYVNGKVVDTVQLSNQVLIESLDKKYSEIFNTEDLVKI